MQQVRWLAQPALAESESDEEAAAAAPREYPRRTGAIAVKVGMTQEWDQWGVRLPLTVLWLDDCQVCRPVCRYSQCPEVPRHPGRVSCGAAAPCALCRVKIPRPPAGR